MSRRLTKIEKIWIMAEYHRTQNQREVLRNWNFQTPEPSDSSVCRLIRKFNENGSIQSLDKKKGRRKSVVNPLNTNIVQAAIFQAPETSVTRRSLELQIGRTSVWRILKSLHLKSYIPTLVHGLREGDPVLR